MQNNKVEMESIVCNYQKYGFCKFKTNCKNEHLEEECQDHSTCVSIKICKRRHPRMCKRYALEKFCRFGSDCAYYHQVQSTLVSKNDNSEIESKVIELKKIVKEMSEKILQLETKVQEIEEKECEKKKQSTW